MIRNLLIKLIDLYQKTLSPDHGWFKGLHSGGYCKYQPSCSQYCKDALNKHGVLRGLPRGAWRVLRCNPWSAGGYDPII